MPTMFHEGTLQSGISRAIQEGKLVGCFVRDDGAESTAWQDEWLTSGWVSSLLEQKAVLLRLEAGSPEAAFLAAFCSIEAAPTFVVIQNGQLREQLGSGVGREEFINRVRRVLGAPPIPGTARAAGGTPRAATPESARMGTDEQNGASIGTPRASSSIPTLPTPEQPGAPIETPQASSSVPMLPTPSQPVGPTETPQASSAPTPPLSSKAKGKQKATPPAPQPDASASKAQQAAREALRKKKEEEKEELARINARIEADKAERKAQAEARKAERERLAQSPSTTSQVPPTTSSRGSNATHVHLNVRMFDGATVRSTFPRTAKLQDDVRPWIDREFAARAEAQNERLPPYYFKQILAPLPSRELSAGDESQTLGDIDLAPSATLVLVPIKGFTEAYAGHGGGIISGAAGSVFGLVGGAFSLAGSAVGYVGSTVSSVLGGGGSAAAQQENQRQDRQQPAEGRPLGNTPQGQHGSAGMRVRTFADQRTGEPRNEQLYNGNQLNFEPRSDESSR